ncbi:MAG: hypothetical protein ACOYO1_18890 [Bacteroidales bacterium]
MKRLSLLSKIDAILLKKSSSRKWLASEIGCSVQNLETVLRTGDPKLSFSIKLANILNVNIFELFEIENKYNETDTIIVKDNGNKYIPTDPLMKRLDRIIELLENKEFIK